MVSKRRRQKKPLAKPSEVKPPATNRALSALLRLLDLDPRAAAAALGVEPDALEEYRSGKRALALADYRRMCATFGEEATGNKLLDLAADVVGEAPPPRESVSAEVIAEIGRLGERLAATLPARLREAIAKEAREQALGRWEALKKLAPEHWRLTAAAASEVRCWAFVKVVGEASAEVSSTDAGRALELASFALWVAERVPGDESWSSRIFAWEVLADARRLVGDLAGAEEASACLARLQAERPEELAEPQ